MAKTLMLMMMMMSLAALCSGEDRVYKLLYQGGTMIDAPYVDYGTISKVRCAAICKLIPECWVYTWDRRTSQCRTLAPLTALVTTTSAHTALNTYFAYSIGGKSIHLTPNPLTWNDGKTECEDMGGQLAIPRDVTHVMLLHHILQEKKYFIGIHRLPSNEQEWLNVEGEVITVPPFWKAGEPNNLLDQQYYLGLYKGLMYDLADQQIRKAICEI